MVQLRECQHCAAKARSSPHHGTSGCSHGGTDWREHWGAWSGPSRLALGTKQAPQQSQHSRGIAVVLGHSDTVVGQQPGHLRAEEPLDAVDGLVEPPQIPELDLTVTPCRDQEVAENQEKGSTETPVQSCAPSLLRRQGGSGSAAQCCSRLSPWEAQFNLFISSEDQVLPPPHPLSWLICSLLCHAVSTPVPTSLSSPVSFAPLDAPDSVVMG